MNARELLKKYAAGVRDFRAANLAEMNLSGVNLSGANLSRANLSVANLSGANLSDADLSQARLNVARLSGANLSRANLFQANLNVANLIRADLGEAELTQAALIRAELIRADLSGANLKEANLSGADLREAALRQAKLSHASLSDANLRGAFLTSAILEGANLNGADLSRSDLSGCNLRETEFRQTSLSRANLSGADLSGANLRWADLSGANLRWANLSEAKLSGANLIGADLSNANLLNASLVHADLTQARLIRADWIGADLTGAILTGAKLHAVSRFGLKTAGVTCEWVDLSPNGDRSQVFQLSGADSERFFNETLPTVRILVDAPLDWDANLALASFYRQMVRAYPAINRAPSLNAEGRKTTLSFRIGSNADLFAIAYFTILPFSDAAATQHNIVALVKALQTQNLKILTSVEQERVRNLITSFTQASKQIDALQCSKLAPSLRSRVKFFQAPTNTTLTNSSTQTLKVYHHPAFGKHVVNQPSVLDRPQHPSAQTPESTLPPVGRIVEFIKSFDYVGQPGAGEAPGAGEQGR